MTYQDLLDPLDPQYKQWLISKILSGATDYTYGPGSPGATPADMRQRTGSHDNRLVTGNIALPPSDYALFTPQERAQYGIADKSMIDMSTPTPRGSVERYYGSGSPAAAGPSASDPANFGSDLAQGMGLRLGAYGPEGVGTSFEKGGFDSKGVGKAVVSSSNQFAEQAAQRTQESTQKAMKMIYDRQKDPRVQALMQVADPLAPSLMGGGGNTAALQQLLAMYLGKS